MINSDQPTYIESYVLQMMIQNQQGIPHHYNTNNYFGSCYHESEKEHSNFLQNYIDGKILVHPSDYDTLRTFLFILRDSSYKNIIKNLPLAKEKLEKDMFLHQFSHRTNKCEKNTYFQPKYNNPSEKYSVLLNKKKSNSLSSNELMALGDNLYQETTFNTSKLKNIFINLVNLRVDTMIRENKTIDQDTERLIKKYASQTYKMHYANYLVKKDLEQRQNTEKPVKQEKTVKQGLFARIKNKFSEHKSKKITQPYTTKPFYETSEQKIKNVLNKVKKPLFFGTLLTLSLFGAKKMYDYTEQQQSYNSINQTEYTYDNSKLVDNSKTIDLDKTEQITKKSETKNYIETDMGKKSVKQLNYLKKHNPIDKNIDVTSVINNLYEKFGENTYNVILSCTMKPYMLNNYMNFDFRPSTHNMLDYITKNNLNESQQAQLQNFIQTHILTDANLYTR